MDMEDRPVAPSGTGSKSQYASQVYILMGSKRLTQKVLWDDEPGNFRKVEDVTIIADGQDEDAAVSGVATFLGAQK